MICVFEGCDKKLQSNNTSGYCRKHYHGSPVHRARKSAQRRAAYVPKVTGRFCVVEDCGRMLRGWNTNEVCWVHHDLTESRKKSTVDRSAKRRAVIRELFVEEVDRLVVFERDLGICHLCDLEVDPTDWHLDHVIPLNLNGPHAYGNVAVSHPFCNESKNDKYIPSLNPFIDSSAREAFKLFHGINFEEV